MTKRDPKMAACFPLIWWGGPSSYPLFLPIGALKSSLKSLPPLNSRDDTLVWDATSTSQLWSQVCLQAATNAAMAWAENWVASAVASDTYVATEAIF